MTQPSRPEDPHEAECCGWLELRLREGLQRREAHRLLRLHATPERVLREIGRSDPAVIHGALDRARSLGLRVLSPAQFPDTLGEIPDPPLVLWSRGEVPASFAPALAVVGSRRASPAGLWAAREFSAEVARAGVTIVSGLAYGVDKAAHQGALEGGGRTVAVLASGLDRPSPSGNAGLARRLLEAGGAWLS